MLNRRKVPAVALPVEDGTISAQALPLDRDTAARKYETITFGLG
jgi:hypothetical protein